MVNGRKGSTDGVDCVDFRGWWRSCAALRMRDSRDTVGILTLRGYHLTVSHIWDELVEGIHMRCHLQCSIVGPM